METVMYVRLIVVAALTLTMGNPLLAEPAKTHDQQPTAQPATPPAAVVLASAETVSGAAPSADQPATPAKRPRVARVTTCRCGDQQAQNQQ
jgi:hypothetical protein